MIEIVTWALVAILLLWNTGSSILTRIKFWALLKRIERIELHIDSLEDRWSSEEAEARYNLTHSAYALFGDEHDSDYPTSTIPDSRNVNSQGVPIVRDETKEV
jgi:hypothetical protein